MKRMVEVVQEGSTPGFSNDGDLNQMHKAKRQSEYFQIKTNLISKTQPTSTEKLNSTLPMPTFLTTGMFNNLPPFSPRTADRN